MPTTPTRCVDSGTGTVRIRGVFPNPGGAITPGQFVRVRLPIERRENALLVPSLPLGSDQAGEYLLVVGKGDIVERRAVKVGTEVNGMRRGRRRRSVPSDRVVVEGLLRAPARHSRSNPNLRATSPRGNRRGQSPTQVPPP